MAIIAAFAETVRALAYVGCEYPCQTGTRTRSLALILSATQPTRPVPATSSMLRLLPIGVVKRPVVRDNSRHMYASVQRLPGARG
jgi:hypothetical protein